MIKWVVGAILSPFVKLGEKYLDNQKDQERLRHATGQVALNTDAAIRKVKLSHWMGRLPLFIMECAIAYYVVTIMIDSTHPSTWFNPVEIPDWFKPHFESAMISILGLNTTVRVASMFKRN